MLFAVVGLQRLGRAIAFRCQSMLINSVGNQGLADDLGTVGGESLVVFLIAHIVGVSGQFNLQFGVALQEIGQYLYTDM